ncbi:hypothetical protein UVI_02023990 [Ustilaginoidea virens]|uniref:AGC-kinase C-terminal domain-containing protein n=1 Tax=Ustilaginoidea virens TaxID=1159556 RepID=A0A1B5KZM3_USTVR|nr:hypothetical protein UVI_02023990 [Ustilaginoidea virens]
MGATWESFIYNDFFRTIDFDLLEQKRIEPIFIPSSDKTNFDATYDLEELLLEEAPLEARARRQKPREKLKEDATDQEIREEELYRMIEKDFQSFDYTVAAYKKYVIPVVSPGIFSSSPLFCNLVPFQDAPALTWFARITEEASRNVDSLPRHDMTPYGGPQALTTDEATPFPPPASSLHQPFQPGPSQVPSPFDSRQGRPTRPAPPPPLFPCEHLSPPLAHASNRVASRTGGLQVTLDGGGSWSDLARQDATLPTDANVPSDAKPEGSSGMFGFLKGKRGRNNSPRPKERGVLGKEGARVVIS